MLGGSEPRLRAAQPLSKEIPKKIGYRRVVLIKLQSLTQFIGRA